MVRFHPAAHALVVQRIGRLCSNEENAGSNPAEGTKKTGNGGVG